MRTWGISIIGVRHSVILRYSRTGRLAASLDGLLAFVREGDTEVVHSMDRLARNLDDLRRRRAPGLFKGQFTVPDDFHEAGREEIERLFEGDKPGGTRA